MCKCRCETRVVVFLIYVIIIYIIYAVIGSNSKIHRMWHLFVLGGGALVFPCHTIKGRTSKALLLSALSTVTHSPPIPTYPTYLPYLPTLPYLNLSTYFFPPPSTPTNIPQFSLNPSPSSSSSFHTSLPLSLPPPSTTIQIQSTTSRFILLLAAHYNQFTSSSPSYHYTKHTNITHTLPSKLPKLIEFVLFSSPHWRSRHRRFVLHTQKPHSCCGPAASPSCNSTSPALH